MPGPPLILGGRGGPRSLELACAHADEYNLIFATQDVCRRVARVLSTASHEAPRLSALIAVVIADSAREAEREAGRLAPKFAYPSDIAGPTGLPVSWIFGTPGHLGERLAELRSAGVERVVVQIPAHRRPDLIGLVAETARRLG